MQGMGRKPVRGPGEVWAHEESRFRTCSGKTGRDLVHAVGGREGTADSTQSLQCDPRCGGPQYEQAWGTTDVFWVSHVGSEVRGAQESGRGPLTVGWAYLRFVPTPPLQPSPRTATSAHFRDPCPGHGCRNHHPGKMLGQVAGGLVTVTTLTTHRQKLSLPAKSAVQGLPRGPAGEEDCRRRGDRPGPHVRPHKGPQGQERSQHGA